MSWDALVKKTFRKKEEILPMQMAEVSCRWNFGHFVRFVNVTVYAGVHRGSRKSR